MLGQIRIGNKRKSSSATPEAYEVIFNIDRPNPLANPYAITKTQNRQEVIMAFRKALDLDIRQRSGPRYQEICRIAQCVLDGQDVILMCWCQPLPCHGQVIKEAIEQMVRPPGKRR